MDDTEYINLLRLNKEETAKYYLKSKAKTFQQMFLEKEILPDILPKDFIPKVIADIACGGGTLTYHIKTFFPSAKFILLDMNEDALTIAKEINNDINAEFLKEDFLNTSIPSCSCDIVFCMQTLLSVSDPKGFITKLIEITKKGGIFIISSLFNIEYDVDLYVKAYDHTKKGNYIVNYNTFSKRTVKEWIDNKVSFWKIKPFYIPTKIEKAGRGLGSHTIETKEGKYITISGGLMLNWGFLYGVK